MVWNRLADSLSWWRRWWYRTRRLGSSRVHHVWPCDPLGAIGGIAAVILLGSHLATMGMVGTVALAFFGGKLSFRLGAQSVRYGQQKGLISSFRHSGASFRLRNPSWRHYVLLPGRILLYLLIPVHHVSHQNKSCTVNTGMRNSRVWRCADGYRRCAHPRIGAQSRQRLVFHRALPRPAAYVYCHTPVRKSGAG